ncbi:MAG TPA: GtrA family protein [Sphingobium sp.]
MRDHRFLGFLLAGGINTLFGYGAYSGLVLLSLPPHIALTVSSTTGVLFNFLTTGTVFRSRNPRLLPRFLIVYAVTLALNMLLLDLLMRVGLGPLLAQAFALPIVTPLTFLAMRRFVFMARPEHAA